MTATEMLSEIIGSPFGQQMKGNARSIGSNQRTRTTKSIDLFKQAAFDRQILHHRLNDPVGRSDPGHMIVKITCLDQPERLLLIKGGRRGSYRDRKSEVEGKGVQKGEDQG